MICVRCLVDGRVQGVFFRASTQAEAEKLGVTGHAINLPDGRVEVLACGQPEAVEALKTWLGDGPRHASVTAVSCESLTPEPLPTYFSTG